MLGQTNQPHLEQTLTLKSDDKVTFKVATERVWLLTVVYSENCMGLIDYPKTGTLKPTANNINPFS